MNHLDAYRLENAASGEDLDIDELLDGKPLLVEWPEHIQAALPGDCLLVKMTWMADEQRGMVITAKGTRYNEMLNQFKLWCLEAECFWQLIPPPSGSD